MQTIQVWYSANVWKKPIWHVLMVGTLLNDILLDMEKENIGSYCFEAGCVEPGCDNVDTPLRCALAKLEK